MKRSIALSAAVLASITAGTAFAQATGGRAPAPGQETGAAQQSGSSETSGAQQAGANQAGGQQENQQQEQQFIRHASSDNNFEVQAGQFIEQKAQNPQVKQLAQRIVQDHQRAEQQLRQVAQQMGVNLSQQLNPVHQAMLQELQKMQGQALETNFAFSQVGDHEKDILSYLYQEEHATSPQLKQYVQQTTPTLREHLQLAQQAADQFVPNARTASEQIPGRAGSSQSGATETQNQNGISGSRSGTGTQGGTTGTESGTGGTGRTR